MVGWPVTDKDDWCGEHPFFPDYLRSLKIGGPTDLSALGLSQRVLNILDLYGDGITTVEQLAAMTPTQLRKWRQFGDTALNEVRLALHRLGLHLATDDWGEDRPVTAHPGPA